MFDEEGDEPPFSFGVVVETVSSRENLKKLVSVLAEIVTESDKLVLGDKNILVHSFTTLKR